MKVYTYSQARQNLSELLNLAENEDILIRRRDGRTYIIKSQKSNRSPFDIPGIDTNISTKEILEAVKDSRSHR